MGPHGTRKVTPKPRAAKPFVKLPETDIHRATSLHNRKRHDGLGGALAGAVERRDEVHEKGEIAVLGRRLTVFEAAVFVVGRVEAVCPGLVGERGIRSRSSSTSSSTTVTAPGLHRPKWPTCSSAPIRDGSA